MRFSGRPCDTPLARRAGAQGNAAGAFRYGLPPDKAQSNMAMRYTRACEFALTCPAYTIDVSAGGKAATQPHSRDRLMTVSSSVFSST